MGQQQEDFFGLLNGLISMVFVAGCAAVFLGAVAWILSLAVQFVRGL